MATTIAKLIVGLLVEGAVGAIVLIVIAALLSRFATDVAGRSSLVIFLFAAAGAYFGFAVAAGAGLVWTLVELAQVVVFGSMALVSLRGSPYWLAAGWTLHPVWDGLHYIGPGRSFAPLAYAIACVSFDLLVAAYIAAAYRRGARHWRTSRWNIS
jgi:hypothetical protein